MGYHKLHRKESVQRKVSCSRRVQRLFQRTSHLFEVIEKDNPELVHYSAKVSHETTRTV